MKSNNSINILGILTTIKNAIKYALSSFPIRKIMSKQINK